MKKISLILISLLIAAGCGTNVFEGLDDKDSKEAMDLEISRRLDSGDSGDYQWILDNPDKVNATDYAAAAMGKAGLDPTELIDALNDISQQSTDGTNDLGAVASLPINPDALDEIQTAKEKLEEELAANPTDPDLNFQMVMLSLSSAVTALGQVGQGLTGVTVTDGISPTEATIIGDNVTDSTTVDTNGDGTDETALTELLTEDIGNVITSLQYADLGASDLNQVLTDTTQGTGGMDGNSDGTVTSQEISTYLTDVLGQ